MKTHTDRLMFITARAAYPIWNWINSGDMKYTICYCGAYTIGILRGPRCYKYCPNCLGYGVMPIPLEDVK